MGTRKLFYEDCHLFEFEATVLSCTENGSHFAIVLDATAFYPEGGGQACDLGVLGTAKVLDVQEEGEEVVHYCDSSLPVGETVHGSIDALRRTDLMQQHSGEHIVSGIIAAKYGYHNVGFHVGADCMEIDFDGPIAPEAIAEIETLANEAIWANKFIHCWIPSPEELPNVQYRSKRALPWPVRIVEIPGIDTCACCGVHVAFTGEIGLIKLLSCVKLRSGVRIEMVCGRRALCFMQKVFNQNKAISQLFSAKMLETADAAQKIADQLAAEKQRAAALQSKLLLGIAAGYENSGNVVHFEDGLNGGHLRELAENISKVCGGYAAVLTGQEGNYSLCIASKNGDLAALTAALKQAFNARGGGKGGFFQGTLPGKKDEILSFFQSRQA